MSVTDGFDVTAHLDGVLLGRIQSGDQSALSGLYDSRSRLIYSIVLNIVHNTEDAEEVTQAVFMRIWAKAQSFDPQRGSVLVWIVTIARRLAIDRTRSKHHRIQKFSDRLESVSQQDLVQPGSENVHNQVIQSILVDRALKRLNKLNSEQREIIELSYYCGFSQTEIAQKIATPLGTVKSRLRAAVTRLRDIMGNGE